MGITGYLGCELTIDGLAMHGTDTERIRFLKPDFARPYAPRAPS